MKKSLLFLSATLALLLMSACSTPSSENPGTDGPAASTSASQPPAPQESAGENCTPIAGGIPASVEDFKCLNLSSVSGNDASGELAWLGTDPFTIVTFERDGQITFSSKTPCNTLMGSAEVTATQLIVGPNLAMTMMACQSPQSDYERWAATFFSAPLDYTLNKDSIVLSNDHGTVTFKANKA